MAVSRLQQQLSIPVSNAQHHAGDFLCNGHVHACIQMVASIGTKLGTWIHLGQGANAVGVRMEALQVPRGTVLG